MIALSPLRRPRGTHEPRQSSVRALLAVAACAVAFAASVADPAKVLRLAQFDIDTLDPHQYADDPSFQVVMALFEPLYEWDYLSPTPKLVPLTAAAPPEITDGGRVWTIRLQRGIHFNADPAFKGRPRELTADDYVYSYKRWLDPNGRRAGNPVLADLILGARPVVEAAKKTGKLDFAAPIEGLRALDRYTLQIRMTEPNYPTVRDLLGFVGAAAHEVVEAAGPDLRTRPVGTGPFRLKEWKRGSRIVLEANPGYREAYFPESDRRQDADLVQSMKGKRAPFVGRVEINIVDEDITRLLLSEQGGLDFVQLRGEIATRMLADGKLKPEYAARGITRLVNVPQFAHAAYDRAAEEFLRSASDEEQIAAARTMFGIARTYMPQLPVYFRLESNYVQPWLRGFRPGVFSSYWKYLDVDPSRRK